jgi:hypothetical protein
MINKYAHTHTHTHTHTKEEEELNGGGDEENYQSTLDCFDVLKLRG